ncbi:MAG: glycerol-3-phosphate dehydrogenase, partial [Exiguobacterium sp.]|nr:glycerol-3-phosphate dehydrogenase [Exiguobacterium sp.]
QAGLAIGRADDAAEFLKNNTKTTEGIATTKVVYDKAKELGIEMPITEAVYQVLYELKKPSEIIGGLMSRSLKSEAD